jgi:hypothetical protein
MPWGKREMYWQDRQASILCTASYVIKRPPIRNRKVAWLGSDRAISIFVGAGDVAVKLVSIFVVHSIVFSLCVFQPWCGTAGQAWVCRAKQECGHTRNRVAYGKLQLVTTLLRFSGHQDRFQVSPWRPCVHQRLPPVSAMRVCCALQNSVCWLSNMCRKMLPIWLYTACYCHHFRNQLVVKQVICNGTVSETWMNKLYVNHW